MVYVLLADAIGVEVAATSLLPRRSGFTVPLPTVAVVAGHALSIFLLAHVVKSVPV